MKGPLKCPNCNHPLPWNAVFPLSFGSRSFRCRQCGALCYMKPRSYIKWSLIPLVAMALSALAVLSGSLWLFVVLIIAIRATWVFAAPRLVPIEFAKPRGEPVARAPLPD